MEILAGKVQRIWKWSAVGGREFPKATQYYVEVSFLRGHRMQGICFGAVVEVSGVRGVGDTWCGCSQLAVADTPGSMGLIPLMVAVRGLFFVLKANEDELIWL